MVKRLTSKSIWIDFSIYFLNLFNSINLNYSVSAAESKVTSVNHQDLTFTLNLVRSDKTFNNPEQQWSFVSNYAVTDYSGDYTIELLPCTVPADRAYTDPPKCELKFRDQNLLS